MVEDQELKENWIKSNIQSKFIRGLRVTDKNIINIVEKVLIDFNLDIVESLNNLGTKAISIHTKKNNVIHVIPESDELGFVGKPKNVNSDIIKKTLEKNIIPIISPLGLGENNQTYNINGDTAAGAVAKSLKSRRLILMTNIDGVLNENKKLIEEITSSKIIKMIEDEIITEGMIPKINTCLDAVNNGVTGVVIVDGRKPHSILFEIFSDKGSRYFNKKMIELKNKKNLLLDLDGTVYQDLESVFGQVSKLMTKYISEKSHIDLSKLKNYKQIIFINTIQV